MPSSWKKLNWMAEAQIQDLYLQHLQFKAGLSHIWRKACVPDTVKGSKKSCQSNSWSNGSFQLLTTPFNCVLQSNSLSSKQLCKRMPRIKGIVSWDSSDIRLLPSKWQCLPSLGEVSDNTTVQKQFNQQIGRNGACFEYESTPVIVTASQICESCQGEEYYRKLLSLHTFVCVHIQMVLALTFVSLLSWCISSCSDRHKWQGLFCCWLP